MVYRRDDELEEAADQQSCHEQIATIAKTHDDEGVGDEGKYGNSGENIGHGEGIGYFGHLEEVGFECCEGCVSVVQGWTP